MTRGGQQAGALKRLLAHAVPTREKLESNRWLRPFAHLVLRPGLWRFNRRSVPRGVALGLFVGILIPFAHSFVAALVAVAVRANIPVAVATTLLSNPATWVLIFPVAYKVGKFLLHADAAMSGQPVSSLMSAGDHTEMLHRLTGKGLALAYGLLVEATVVAALGYVLTSVIWRCIVTRRRRRRLGSGIAVGRA
ncbi:MAG TPA: DUF2062 domain-containing protein [Novosphingobium sp.]|nr:DUF2062 domain-containing protein [Novosphingobium sp.]